MSAWYLKRLKSMSFAEIYFRINQSFQKQYELFSYKYFLPSSDLISCNGKLINSNLTSIELFPDTISVFGKEFNYLSNDIDWHRDIFSGESFPVIFSKKLNIRINPKVSAKNVWEINRLQFLPHLVLNYRTSGREYYLTKFVNILTSWIDQNPYLQGINWYSNIEVNIRLISWFFCWQILDIENLVTENKQFKDFVETKWVPTIYQHCFYSYNNPSRFSSANNHLISEYAGLFMTSSLWKFKESEKWLQYAGKGLEEEIKLQHSSGINKEEAAEYIQFITDFFLLSFIIGEKTNRPFSVEYRKHLNEIFNYIFNLLDCESNFPKYGDEDDGKCINLTNDDNFNNFKSLLTSGSIIFKDQIFKSKSNGFDLKNNILFGEAGKLVYESIPDIFPIENSKFFKDEGHFIFRKHEKNNEIYLHFDAAPLGYLSIAAHGHADALSFILHVDGQPVFIDPGTYTYHTEPEWRRYFVGTLAHNTIRINKKNQAINAGPTLWLKHYKPTIIVLSQGEEIDRVKATHNGYKKEQAEHIREIVFDKLRNEFLISDTISIRNKKTIEVEIPFHIHPEVIVNVSGENCFLLSTGTGGKIEFCIDEKLNPDVIKGQTEPQILGWFSKSFLKKVATNVIYNYTQIKCTTTFNFVIKIL
jgi:hypothetical protein